MKSFKEHAQLHTLKQGEELSILKADFEGFQQVVTFEDLVITKRNRHIGFVDGDEKLPFEIMHQIGGVDFYGYKSTYESLGLYLFQLLFSNKEYIHLKLPRAQSEIQNVFLYIQRFVSNDFYLKSAPIVYTGYDYFREYIEKFPLSGRGFSERSVKEDACPTFLLACSDYQKNYDAERVKHADQLIISVTIDGLCALATVFLDMAAEENERDEVCLEHPTLGFGGTGANSLEARFWLPNSLGFYCDSLNDLKV